MAVQTFTNDIDYERLAAASPQFRMSRDMAHESGLTEVRSQRWVSNGGFTLRITFRGPQHRAGDAEILFKLRGRHSKRRAR